MATKNREPFSHPPTGASRHVGENAANNGFETETLKMDLGDSHLPGCMLRAMKSGSASPLPGT
jgi:hypothetical protein